MPIKRLYLRRLEKVCRCDCPIAVFTLDARRFVAFADFQIVESVVETHAVACAHLYVRQQFNTESEVPRDVAFLLVHKFFEVVLLTRKAKLGPVAIYGFKNFETTGIEIFHLTLRGMSI